jgi:hypothetical protein
LKVLGDALEGRVDRFASLLLGQSLHAVRHVVDDIGLSSHNSPPSGSIE